MKICTFSTFCGHSLEHMVAYGMVILQQRNFVLCKGNRDIRAGMGHRCYGQDEKSMREELNTKKEKSKITYVVQYVSASVTIKVDGVSRMLLKPEASFITYLQQYDFGLQ